MSRGLRRAPLWRLGLGVGLLVGLVGAGLGAVVLGALRAANAERELSHQVLADRAFDAMEAELSALLAREEARSFLQYRRTYTPEGLVSGQRALVRSPLADPPEEPALVGYFQIDPDGTLSTPMKPEAGEPDSPGDEARVALLLALAAEARDLGQAPAQTGGYAQQQEQVASNRYAVEQSLNKGSQARQVRTEKKQKAAPEEVASFQNDWIPNPLSRDAGYGSAARREASPKDDPPAAPARARGMGAGLNPAALDVNVSPLQGAAADDAHLLLYRDVTLAGQRYRQGLALDVPSTVALLGERALAGSLLQDLALLRGPEDPEAVPAAYVRSYTHTFAPPFEALGATLWMQPVPDQGSSVTWILWLSVALGVVGALGLVAVGGQVLATVRFADRRSNFVAAVSHELKTPLTAIRMYAEMLRDDLVASEEKRRSYYEIITMESERLTRLIQNVLELARLERGSRAVALEMGDPVPVLREVARTLSPHAAEHGFTLEVVADGPLPAARFDRDALTQILVNLVDNAIKFSADAADRRVVLEASAAADGVSVRVRDHGPGVPARHLRRVFEPFYRGERELVRKTRGTGIGLALVDGLVRGMGGRVSAYNARDGGLVVELRLVAV